MKLVAIIFYFVFLVAISLSLVSCGGGGGGGGNADVTINNSTQPNNTNSGNAIEGTSQTGNTGTQTVPGSVLRILDEEGNWTDGEVFYDVMMPPFAYNAHIIANPRNANFPIGGLHWSGYVNLSDSGGHAFKLNIDVGDLIPNGDSLWSIQCITFGNVGALQFGERTGVSYFSSVGDSDSFQSDEIDFESGLQSFSLTMRCYKSGGLNWRFEPAVYERVTATLEVLGPSDVNFQPLPSSAYSRDLVVL